MKGNGPNDATAQPLSQLSEDHTAVEKAPSPLRFAGAVQNALRTNWGAVKSAKGNKDVAEDAAETAKTNPKSRIRLRSTIPPNGPA